MIKDQLMQIVGADYVVADDQLAPWSRDWSGAYQYTPLAVARPVNTQQ
ncbi:MAG: FAD-binding oxidoreductase, partial [Marinovum sp.]|nr:FAD-binding oxidoreductase [Marinovum sp.]